MGSRITSIVSVCLVLVLLGLSAMTGICARALGDDLRGGHGFTVIMEADADTTLVRDVAEMLAADRAVREVKMLSADSILASERAFLGSDFALEPGVNPYSAEIEVKMKPEHAVADSVAAMSQYYSQCEGVARVATQGEVLDGVESTLSRTNTVLLILAGVLLLVSVALINNTVSLSVYSRRFLIHTMRLVGATPGFIRRPFVRSGAINGLIASVVACALVCTARIFAAGVDIIVARALSWPVMAVMCAALVAAGVLLAALTSYFATNRYLAASYDEMFLK